MQKWYALRVKPHKERTVRQRLEADAVALFLPTVPVNPKNPRAAKEKPYFPGYLFVRADLGRVGQNAFSWMPGTLGLVAFGGVPAPVPDVLIDALREKLALADSTADDPDPFEKGETVRIVRGPFAGYEAIFDAALPGSERVQILLAFLSTHPHPVRIDSDSIKKKG